MADTSTHPILLKLTCSLLAVTAAGVWLAPRAVQGQASTQTGEDRLSALEKAVLRNAEKPDATILARLDRIEKLLQIDATQTRQRAATDAKTFDELKATVVSAERERDAIDRRLRDVERLKLDKSTSDVASDLRDMKRDLDGLKNSVRDLSDRLRREEQR
jgi:hypothetical protein